MRSVCRCSEDAACCLGHEHEKENDEDDDEGTDCADLRAEKGLRQQHRR